MSSHVDMMKRQTRNHPGLAWEDENLHNQFTDVNRVALDDRYGKVAAPLSKRSNGSGPAGRNAPAGLFGIEDKLKPYLTPTNIILGMTIAGAIWYYKK
tara:strand:+ start:54 stop:347 length:294 start_codon:yes stop_codon:yes gene_type:complete